jgi:hypothetical protein
LTSGWVTSPVKTVNVSASNVTYDHTSQIDSAWIASSSFPAAFDNATLVLGAARIFQWVWQPAAQQRFRLDLPTNADTVFQLRVVLGLNASNLPSFSMQDAAIDIGLEGTRNERGETLLGQEERWFFAALDSTVFTNTELVLTGSGFIPTDGSLWLLFTRLTISLYLPTELAGTRPAVPLLLTPRYVEAGFHQIRGTIGSQILTIVSAELTAPVIICPASQAVTLQAGEDSYTFDAAVLKPEMDGGHSTLTLQRAANTTYRVGTHVVTLIAENEAGTKVQCSFIVSIAVALLPPPLPPSSLGSQRPTLSSGAVAGMASGIILMVMLVIVLAGLYVRRHTK